MSSLSNRPEGMPSAGSCFAAASGGKAAGARATHWLSLAASPTFAVMALLTSVNGEADMICSSIRDTFPLNGMVPMYLLMSVFHLPPWLRVLSGPAERRDRLRGATSATIPSLHEDPECPTGRGSAPSQKNL
jgi:hypothetical protein